jgi:hypothetical protein
VSVCVCVCMYVCARTLRCCVAVSKVTRGTHQGHKHMAKDLIRRGADIQAKNFAGKTCYDLAHEYNYWELGDYLREKVGLPKLGPSAWKGEPGLQALGGVLDDEAMRKLMDERCDCKYVYVHVLRTCIMHVHVEHTEKQAAHPYVSNM